MASTYALPMTPTSHSHSHERSRSQYSTYSSNGSSPMKAQQHRHHRSDMNGSNDQLYGAVRSPYAEYNGHAHEDRGHIHTRSTDTTWTLQPFVNGRAKGRPRGESDLGRSPPRKNGVGRYGFEPVSPIQEAAPAIPVVTSSWLELPEALTAFLIPLPYIFASLAYPNGPESGKKLPSTLSEAVADSAPVVEGLTPTTNPQFLHALTLSSATLLLVGIIAKISSSLQPLDRRKQEAKQGTFDIKKAPKSMAQVILSVLLPFYASLQLGGAKVALGLLVAIAAGLGALDRKPGKHTPWDDLRRTLKTRKITCGALALTAFFDCLNSNGAMNTVLAYLALFTSILLVPPPLPTVGWSIMTAGQDAYSGRASLPKPSSPLINSFESTILTILSGLTLTVFAIMYSLVSSASPSLSHYAIGFSTISIASATALVYFPVPTALRNQKKIGLALGSLFVSIFALATQSSPLDTSSTFFPLICAASVGAVILDTRAPKAHSHGHSHSHSGHSHSHSHSHSHDHDHDHHLHGNHSRLSAFLIARSTPGSIIHSILIEKDSRRIAYFGVLNLAFMMVQFFYGFVSGSLGLLTDSIHMLFDCAGLAVGLAAAVMSKWRPNARFPYGYGKIDTLSGFANGVFLLLVSVEIIFDAFERLAEGHELQRLNELLIVSILGFLVNIVGLTAFGHAHHGHGHDHGHDHGHGHDHSHGHSHDNENMQGIFLHILADALGSVAVIISTLLTKYYGWSGWDPIASCIIAVLIFLSAIPLVKSSGARLMLSLPNDVEYGVRNTLGELGTLRGVVGYAVPKFWLEDEGAAHAEVHAKEDDHAHGHNHAQDHDHSHDHSHSNSHSHDHSHAHDHGHNHAHDHSHNHSHDHDHDHAASHKQRILGVMHVIAARNADIEDVRERTTQFLKGRGMEVVVHVELEGEGRCWCGGGVKVN